MSTITYLTNIVTSLTNRFNQLEANSKKVDELPVQTTLEPSSKIPVSRAGISEHLTVQQIISSIQNSNYNKLLAIGTISVSGTDITVPSGVSGQINGLLYGTSTDTILSITLCPTGFSRKDIIVLTTANTVVVISGEETDGAIVLAPPVPTDAVYITEFDVNDSSIGIPVDPIVGNQFVKKSFTSPFISNVTGENAIIPLNPNGYSEIRLNNSDLISISGYDLSLITGISTAEVPYNGKPYVIRNLTGNSIIIKNEDYANSSNPFYLTGGEDLEFPNNQAIYVSYDSAGFNELFKSWISGKQNIVKSVSTDTIAVKDEFYHVVGNMIFTDPITADENDQYSVVCVNGTATIGGVVYPIGSYVVRSYIGGVWVSELINAKDYDVFFQRISIYSGLVENTYMGYIAFNNWGNYNTADANAIVPTIYSVSYIVPYDCYLESFILPSLGFNYTGGYAVYKTDVNVNAIQNPVLVYNEELTTSTYFFKRELPPTSQTFFKKGQGVHLFFKRNFTSLFHGQIYLYFKRA